MLINRHKKIDAAKKSGNREEGNDLGVGGGAGGGGGE